MCRERYSYVDFVDSCEQDKAFVAYIDSFLKEKAFSSKGSVAEQLIAYLGNEEVLGFFFDNRLVSFKEVQHAQGTNIGIGTNKFISGLRQANIFCDLPEFINPRLDNDALIEWANKPLWSLKDFILLMSERSPDFRYFFLDFGSNADCLGTSIRKLFAKLRSCLLKEGWEISEISSCEVKMKPNDWISLAKRASCVVPKKLERLASNSNEALVEDTLKKDTALRNPDYYTLTNAFDALGREIFIEEWEDNEKFCIPGEYYSSKELLAILNKAADIASEKCAQDIGNHSVASDLTAEDKFFIYFDNALKEDVSISYRRNLWGIRRTCNSISESYEKGYAASKRHQFVRGYLKEMLKSGNVNVIFDKDGVSRKISSFDNATSEGSLTIDAITQWDFVNGTVSISDGSYGRLYLKMTGFQEKLKKVPDAFRDNYNIKEVKNWADSLFNIVVMCRFIEKTPWEKLKARFIRDYIEKKSKEEKEEKGKEKEEEGVKGLPKKSLIKIESRTVYIKKDLHSDFEKNSIQDSTFDNNIGYKVKELKKLLDEDIGY